MPGGRLCHCNEADSGEDPLSATFAKVFEKYKVREPSPALTSKRRLRSLVAKEARRAPSFFDPSKGERLLESAGFAGVRHFTESVEVAIPARALLEPSLLWGIWYEYAAMARPIRERFRREALTAIRPLERMKGAVNFFSARKPPP